MTECIFGWGKQHGTMRKTKHRGSAAVAADFMLNLIAYNLVRIPKLIALCSFAFKLCHDGIVDIKSGLYTEIHVAMQIGIDMFAASVRRPIWQASLRLTELKTGICVSTVSIVSLVTQAGPLGYRLSK